MDSLDGRGVADALGLTQLASDGMRVRVGDPSAMLRVWRAKGNNSTLTR
jgi:hypothetical protein